MRSAAPGYMILLTLMVAATAVAAVTYLARKTTVYLSLTAAAVEQEKALQLAFSGIQVALSQLAGEKVRKQDDEKKPVDAQAADKQMLTFLLPVLGRWQTFELKEKTDGINGTIDLCITSEDGKLDLNAIYDFKEKKFLAEQENNEEKNYRKIVENLLTAVGTLTGAERLFVGLEEFLKKQDAPLGDITQLLTIKEFEPFKTAVFYEPSGNKKTIALADLFTVWSGSQMNAWLLSPSMQRTIGNKKADFTQPMDKDLVEKVVAAYDPNLKLPQAWDKMFAPLYDVPLASLPTYVKGIVNIKFGPRIFSVLSYGTVGKTEQKLLAIIALKKDPSSASDAAYSVAIKKLYWL